MAKKQTLSPILVPEPRSMEIAGGTHAIEPNKLIVIDAAPAHTALFAAQEAQRALSEFAGVTWHLYAAEGAPAQSIGLTIALEAAGDHTDIDRQAYQLSIDAKGIRIDAMGEAGALYGVMTLKQLLRQYGASLPHLRVEDHPDFARRGIMVDISRDKVPTMTTLFDLVDLMTELKLNELQLYTEHTFAFQRHPVVWAQASPMTGEEVMQLDAYCRARGIDLVPNQNCFGHMRRWLIHKEYRDLAEAPNGCNTRWGFFAEPFTLNPGDPRSIQLVEEMFDELLPHYSSALFNVGCDETVDLGEGASKADVEARGVGRVYLDFLLKIYAQVKKHNRTMQFWGDIIMEHPELVPDLPKDVVAMEWGYEFDHPFADHGAKFAASGITFYVVPGTSTWNSLGGRTDNAIGNLLNAAENGLKNGAVGYLNTDWGDNGHLQPLPVSYLPYAYGAAVSWCVSENRDTDIAMSASLHVFGDPTGAAGKLAYDLGNVYGMIPGRIHNNTAPALGVITPAENLSDRLTQTPVDRKVYASVAKALAKLETQAGALKMNRDDAALIRSEFAHAIHLMQWGMNRLQRIQNPKAAAEARTLKAQHRKLVAEHDKVWLARNRAGGMGDSAANIKF
jgi:hypothetical protein